MFFQTSCSWQETNLFANESLPPWNPKVHYVWFSLHLSLCKCHGVIPWTLPPTQGACIAWPNPCHPPKNGSYPRSVTGSSSAVSQLVVSWPPREQPPGCLSIVPWHIVGTQQIWSHKQSSSKGISSMCILSWEPHWLWKNNSEFERPSNSFGG